MYVSNGDLEMSKQQSELGSFQKNFVVSQCYQTLDLEFPSKWSTRLGSGRSGARDSFPNQKRKRAAPTRAIYNYEQKSRRHSHSQVKYNHSDAFQSEWREPDPTRRSLFSRNFNRYVFLIRLFSPWPTAKKKKGPRIGTPSTFCWAFGPFASGDDAYLKKLTDGRRLIFNLGGICQRTV